MKRIFLLLAIAVIPACQSAETEDMIDGGWVKQNVDSPLVREAYAFAQAEAPRRHKGIQLSPPRSARSRVTEGTELYLECPYGLPGTTGTAAILIFEDINGKRELVSIVLSP